MKLGLGTVQFGLSYGVTNHQGQVSESEVRQILSTAENMGIDLLDTAAAYGESERVLGAILAGQACPFRIVSKTVPLGGASVKAEDVVRVLDGLADSRRYLHQQTLDSVLIHNVNDILVPGGDRVYALLQEQKEEGKIRKIGISIYDKSQIEAVLSLCEIDLIQIPFNVFDQRLLKGGLLSDLKRRGIEIHARSIFLQGTLLVTPESLPPILEDMRPMLRHLDQFSAQRGLSKLGVALAFVQRQSEIDYSIVGAQSVAQLSEIYAENNKQGETADLDGIDFSEFAIEDERLINPGLWK